MAGNSQTGLSPRSQPFLYITAALIAGIVIGRRLPLAWLPVTLALSVTIASICAACIVRKMEWAATAFLLAGFFAGGIAAAAAERVSVSPARLRELYAKELITAEEPVEIIGVLRRPPEPAPDAFYLEVETESISINSDSMRAMGVARLFVPITSSHAKAAFNQAGLDYGIRVRVLVRLEKAQIFRNPGSVDFNEFLELKGYDLAGTVKSPLLVENVGQAESSRLLWVLYKARTRGMSALDGTFTPEVAGTLKAMLFGNRYFMDPEVAERLRQGSTFHVLSISGMHIALIAWMLLGGRSALRRRQVIRVAVCVLFLWAYTTMVGLAPPVVRASVMITVALIGPVMFRRSASLNTLAIAAFIILAYSPSLVADPGFQLSFVAVGGIVAVALPIEKRMRLIGEWLPTPQMPHPPRCAPLTRWIAECIFWDQHAFRRAMKASPVTYHADKCQIANRLSQWRIQPVLRAVTVLVLASAAIQITTVPLAAFYFNRVAPVGILLNVTAGLLTGVLMLCGAGAIAVDVIVGFPWLWLGQLANSAHSLLANSVEPFLMFSISTFRVPHYEGTWSVIYYAYYLPVAIGIGLIERWNPVDILRDLTRSRSETGKLGRADRQPRTALFRPMPVGLAVLVGIVLVMRPLPGAKLGKLTVHFLDVGQGDSAAVILPRGTSMLVDGGGLLRTGSQTEETGDGLLDGTFSVGEFVVSRFVWSLGLRRLDYVIATHADHDHIGGLSEVIGNFQIGQMVIGAQRDGDKEHRLLMRSAFKRKIPIGRVSAGQRFDIDGVVLDVLWPPADFRSLSSNNSSLVLMLSYGAVRILLAGDIEHEVEASLVRSGIDLRADILKLPHHGSRTSSSAPFLDAVRPKIAIASVGERSRFGHPHKEVIDRLETRNIAVLKTGLVGTVTIETDGTGLALTTFRDVQSSTSHLLASSVTP